MITESELLAAFLKVENAFMEFTPHKSPITLNKLYELYRQHLVDCMISLEQTGMDGVISAGIESMDRRAEQDGIK